jgi:hypothetical protein
MSDVMRYKLYLIIALIATGNSLLIAGEPHPYLITIAKDIQLPKEAHVMMDLAPNTLTYSFQIQAYTIDSKMRKSYPSSMKEVIGPSNEGFIIRITCCAEKQSSYVEAQWNLLSA